jgi:hypothetical protein
LIKTSYFHVSPEKFLPGDIKPRGSYGALLESNKNYVSDDPDGEFFCESVRQTCYPDKPSRLRSSFVFETIEGFEIGVGEQKKSTQFRLHPNRRQSIEFAIPRGAFLIPI